MTDHKTNLMAQLEQEHMIAQMVSAMPNNVDGMPDVTTPAPIRAKWAHRLYQQGVRVHPELATHKTVVHGSGISGPHGPREFQRIDEDRLLGLIQDQNPQLYKRIKAARADHHGGDAQVSQMLGAIFNRLPQDLQEKLAPQVEKFAAENIPPGSNDDAT